VTVGLSGSEKAELGGPPQAWGRHTDYVSAIKGRTLHFVDWLSCTTSAVDGPVRSTPQSGLYWMTTTVSTTPRLRPSL
jgi:hypothetical protein